MRRASAVSGRLVVVTSHQRSGVAALVVVLALAGCSPRPASSSGTSTTSTLTPTSTSTSTSTTLPASLVSIVAAQVKVAHTADGSVGYRQVGAGPPLILITGFSGSMDSWEPSFVDALGRSHRVVIFDNAGIGETSSLPLPLTITAMANQTAALIQSLRLGQPDILGWSMGGMIAQALTVLHPSLVRRLVLCATYPGNGKATLPSAAVGRTLAAVATGKGGASALSLLFPSDQHAAKSAYVKGILEYPGFYQAPPTVTTAQFSALASWLSGKEAAGRHISEIASPTLVADGLEDVLVPTANDHELVSAITTSTLRLYPDSGHGFFFQGENRFLAVVQQFLAD